jgi:acyl-CoA reductase-like NAD-dependent aldehyde dehydrogenase
MVTFTGSTVVGKHIAVLCAQHGKRVTLELGGKSPMVVLADCDLEKAVSAAVAGIFMFQGQVCMGTSRIFVEAPVFDEFCRRFTAAGEAVGRGDLRDSRTMIGPIISDRQRRRVGSHVSDALSKGARLLSGGAWEGNRCLPTILTGVTPDMMMYDQETFGPVTAIYPVQDAAEGLARANDTAYGLTAAIFTRDLGAALDFAEGADAGMVHVNGSTLQDEPHVPFGGTGDSGVGREGTGVDIDAMTEWKWVTIQR